MKVLTLDIETAPNLAHVWGLFKQNIAITQLAEVSTVICWAAKWHSRKGVEFRSDHHDGHDAMIARAHELLDEADVVVGWNSKAFDIKHLQREFLLADLPPASPHHDVDLLTVARSRFKFASNKLDHVAQQLGVGAKVQHTGFELWLDCMRGDDKAWALMKRYNVQDVRLTEQLYDRLLPWIARHPHQGLYGGPKAGCPRCGSMHAIIRGHRTTAVGSYTRYQCQVCRGYFAGTHRTDAVHSTAV